jgi:hypothetical protein
MVVTHRLPLEEAPTGYKLFNDKEVGGAPPDAASGVHARACAGGHRAAGCQGSARRCCAHVWVESLRSGPL